MSLVVHYYKQFFDGPESPGMMTPRNLMLLLAKRGHQVHVVACDFNPYSEQEEEPEDAGSTRDGGGMHVYRLHASRGMRHSLTARLEAYLGYALRARRFARTLPPPDVVVGSIPPLFTGTVSRSLARRHRVPFLLEVRDLWPDALLVKRAITPWQAWPLQRLANRLYFGSNRIVSLTPGLKTELLKKGVPADKVVVIPNGFDPALHAVPSGTRERLRAELGWGAQLVCVFVGAHVEVTAVETIVHAAALLRDQQDVRFELFGHGQRKAAVMALARELRVRQIQFHESVSKPRIIELLGAADIGLMTLFRSPLIHIYIEAKLLDYMGAAKPILAAMDGMQSQFIRKAQAGKTVASFDHDGLARLVAEARTDYEPFRAMGVNGRSFVARHFLMSDILDRYANLIEAMAANHPYVIQPWDPLAEADAEAIGGDGLPGGQDGR